MIFKKFYKIKKWSLKWFLNILKNWMILINKVWFVCRVKKKYSHSRDFTFKKIYWENFFSGLLAVSFIEVKMFLPFETTIFIKEVIQNRLFYSRSVR